MLIFTQEAISVVHFAFDFLQLVPLELVPIRSTDRSLHGYVGMVVVITGRMVAQESHPDIKAFHTVHVIAIKFGTAEARRLNWAFSEVSRLTVSSCAISAGFKFSFSR